MAVKIKLSRIGKRNDPKYRIVVMEGNKRRDGACIERIGFYDPVPNPHVLEIDKEKLNGWIKNGAQFTEGTRKLLSKLVK